jgi:uncharacterized protein (DUF2267 family)
MSEFNKPTNPPAFPSSIDNGETIKYMLGMTLRDYFAAKAMQAVISNLKEAFSPEEFNGLSKVFYQMADEMLKAREA